MKMIPNKLIEFEKSSSFTRQLGLGNIPRDSIVFIKDTGEIYTNGTCYSSYEEVRKMLFEENPEKLTVSERISRLHQKITGGSTITLKEIEDKLAEYEAAQLKEGKGISIEGTSINAKVDEESIIINDQNELAVGVVSGGSF